MVAIGQTKRDLVPTRTTERVKIDGKFDEIAWQSATVTDNFVQLETNPGASSALRTEVRVLYDDDAVYIAAIMYDPQPDSIGQQYTLRDETSRATDWFGVVFDCYRDGNNGVSFTTTAVGVQRDSKFSANFDAGDFGDAEDKSWNAVWGSATTKIPEGWAVEMAIPYSALRFPEVEVQSWHINFRRYIARYRETSYWNEVKPNVAGTLTQSGLLNGMQHLKTPVRLQAMPFVAAYVRDYFDKNNNPKHQRGKSLTGGMDIKYGLSDAFTLDMTLIPDFGQVQFDKQILNLGPFEVQFNENRQFFTEGTELFNKGNLFYSRRVGGRPLHYFDASAAVGTGETLLENPTTSQLYNATKVSGRTSQGTGIGVFNAIAAPMYATIAKADGTERRFQTAALTNYNVVSIDQNLPNNGYITLINTSVVRSGSDYDANVTGTNFQLRNKKGIYELTGGGAMHQKFYSTYTDRGYKYGLGGRKISGQLQFGAFYNVESPDYDPNDLGFLYSPNERSIESAVSYSIFKPFGAFNYSKTSANIDYSRLVRPDVFTDLDISGQTFFLTKKIFGFGGSFRLKPLETYDYFEPRTTDFSRFFATPTSIGGGAFISSDYRKAFALDVRIFYRNFDDITNRDYTELTVSPRFRPSDKLFFVVRSTAERPHQAPGYVFGGTQSNAVGYEQLAQGDIIFMRRNQITLNNEISGQYTFNNRMGLTMIMRHYWSKVEAKSFHLLTAEGDLAPTPYTGYTAEGTPLHNANFDLFNLDLAYSWRFAPGSDISIVWKNIIQNNDALAQLTYLENLRNLPNHPQTNSISVRITYFIDYATLRH